MRITRPFYLGKYEVTQEQWQAVMGDNPSQFKGPTNPVETVTWGDCQEFLKRLNAKLPDLPSPLGRGAGDEGTFRLPTEAEWEYACRAGRTSKYCFEDDEEQLGEYAWYIGNSQWSTHPVGAKRPNAWGLYDMHGNVEEWCADWYDSRYYANSSQDDPAGPTSGKVRVLRGGSWRYGNYPDNIRCPAKTVPGTFQCSALPEHAAAGSRRVADDHAGQPQDIGDPLKRLGPVTHT